jgi:hypothetical protein
MKLLIFFLFLNFNLAYSGQLIDINGPICVDKNPCVHTNDIFIPLENDQCSNDLMFQFGDDTTAFLSRDGSISSNTTRDICNNAFKSSKYALNGIIIEIMKHKNSVVVKKVTKSENKSKTANKEQTGPIAQLYEPEHIHDFYQYVMFFIILNVGVIKLLFWDWMKSIKW